MSRNVNVPAREGIRSVALAEPAPLETVTAPAKSRLAYAAAHVVADPLHSSIPERLNHIDWDSTIAIRERLWSLGLGVAESMDTAQRGMGITADDAMRLAVRTMREDPRKGRGVAVGVNTDALTEASVSLSQIIDAYRQQIDVVHEHGGTPVIMASRHLARTAQSSADYLNVYTQLLDNSAPAILHWLGAVFDPSLDGYWGGEPAEALEAVIQLISEHESAIAGIKVSLLEPWYELELRRRLPDSVPVFTGDDFNYVDMIAGDESGHSHALLGAFAAVAPQASAALHRLDQNDEQGFREILGPTQDLSRIVFEAPTQYYKTGIAWLAYLAGDQDHFRMLGGLESGRSVLHLGRVLEAAGAIGLFIDPEATAARATRWFAAQGAL